MLLVLEWAVTGEQYNSWCGFMRNFAAPRHLELTHLPEWIALVKHHRMMKKLHLRDLFELDAQRADQFNLEAAGLQLDYSRHRVNFETVRLLASLAEARGVAQAVESLFTGKSVNTTEGRPALHTVLRQQDKTPLYYQGKNIVADVQHVKNRMAELVEKVRAKDSKFTDWVHIGIGGSDLGPRMVAKALAAYQSGPLRGHFVSPVDVKAFHALLGTLDPETTLIMMASKSFCTKEILWYANIAKDWLRSSDHLFAATAYPERAVAFGVDADRVFPLWDWVGGRFSVWSAVGLSLAITLGMDHFNQLLAGAALMDAHFRRAPLVLNMPVLLALFDIWYINFFGVKTRAVLPYEEALSELPAHLQQLEMESNGKRVNHAGKPLDYATAPVVWGCLGSNAQHAFLQLLYQGTQTVPVDFVVSATTHPLQAGDCLRQANALALGKTQEEAMTDLLRQGKTQVEARRLVMHHVILGSNPSNRIVMRAVTPQTVGALVALYEHKVFVEGVVWDINSFDQWGVELGKALALDSDQ